MYLTSPLPFRHQREPHMPKPLDISALTFPHRKLEDDEALEIDPLPHPTPLPSPAPPPPRSPLPPHKLAKLANALGVNTPMPASYRSPSPSGSGAFARTPSRYLLHIVPPTFLPSDDDDDGLEPDGASSVPASSYRSQFRRGTLVPLYPTLQSQLGAIAREYNLPSTGGLVLYLFQSSHDGSQDGPRISDDVWKLLWYKALQAERQDSQPRSASTLSLRSGNSTPSSPFNGHLRDNSQQPMSATPLVPPFPYPSPLTASSPSSEIHLPLPDKDNASSADALSIASDVNPNAFLPILAKVEFDIDRRKASWYDAWAHGKRERSRWRSASDGGKLALELPERARSASSTKRRFRVDTSPPSEGSDYAMLDDGEGDKTAVEEDEETVVLHRQDPLSDVFGHDAATWSEMHAGRQRNAAADSSYPELVIPPGGDAEVQVPKVRDEEEVIKIWDENKRPRLPFLPPDIRASPRKGAPPPLDLNDVSKLSPLELVPNKSRSSNLPYLRGSASDSSSSASEQHSETWMKRRTGMVFGDLEVKIVAEPEDMSEEEITGRSSQIILKHKLDQIEKQLVQLSPRHMKHPPPPVPQYSPELLRSAPPERDKFDLPPTPTQSKSLRTIPSISRRLDPSNTPTHSTRPVDDAAVPVSPRKDSVSSPPGTPQSLEHRRAKSSQSLSGSFSRSQSEQSPGATRPSVPPSVAHLPPTPPLAVQKGRSRDGSISHLRLDRTSPVQHRSSPADDVPSISSVVGNTVSPTVPPSLDLFGRRPSDASTRLPNEGMQSMSTEARSPPWSQDNGLPASVPEHAELDTHSSSRFSADSEQGVERLSKQKNPRVMSVRGLRNLWRKSGVSGNKSVSPPFPAELSPSVTTTPQQALFQLTRKESGTSQRSQRSVTERARRPSVAPRPESDTDPFQFDNSNIYKSPSSSSLGSAITSAASSGSSSLTLATPTGSIGPQSKGILKSRSGSINLLSSAPPPGPMSDAEATRKLRRPGSANRSTPTNASLSDLGERSVESQPPSSSPPPDSRYTITPIIAAAMRRKQTPSPANGLELHSHSLSTTQVTGLSRYPQPFSPLSGRHFDDGATPRLTEFEILPPPTRSTPSSSYTGEVF